MNLGPQTLHVPTGDTGTGTGTGTGPGTGPGTTGTGTGTGTLFKFGKSSRELARDTAMLP